ncbi:MAG: hypothetical protein ACYC5V_10760 [Gemmatimonadaceae bacterium]
MPQPLHTEDHWSLRPRVSAPAHQATFVRADDIHRDPELIAELEHAGHGLARRRGDQSG